jgi:predicted nuclease of restriction endonuclease-like (RecB) superfamily
MSKTPSSSKEPNQPDHLFGEIKDLIQSAKQRAAVAVNAELTLLYWQVGQRINTEVLKGERADYGKQIVPSLAKSLTVQFGRGWSKRNLFQMVRFAELFPDQKIVQTLSAQLSWSHFVVLTSIEDSLKREFYLSMAVEERWSVRTLDDRVDKLLFERTAISRKPEMTIYKELEILREQGRFNEDMVLKDPYVLDFLEMNDTYLEKDLEDAILREIQQFLLELGNGFTFVGRQHRIQIGGDDFYIDLLFYNRKLKRLVAIELKTGSFKAEYKGQMELYLRWLAKYEQEPDENPPLGIILCSGKNQQEVELLELNKSDIHIADYLTHMPSKEVLEERFRQAVRNARQRIENKSEK